MNTVHPSAIPEGGYALTLHRDGTDDDGETCYPLPARAWAAEAGRICRVEGRSGTVWRSLTAAGDPDPQCVEILQMEADGSWGWL